MGESRSELLQWVNQLLQADYTKIEEFGKGWVYCQIMDSIFGNLPMSRVKVGGRQEYEWLSNYKILQTALDKNRVDKNVPVDKLVKCKMQDNLEFTQWLKRFWDANFPGGHYDAMGRLGGAAAMVASTSQAPIRGTATARVSTSRTTSRTPISGATGRATSTSAQSAALEQARRELEAMRLQEENITTEREFYFNKLRDVEVQVGDRLALIEERLAAAGTSDDSKKASDEEKVFLLDIQKILYSTEEGFELPVNEEELQGDDQDLLDAQPPSGMGHAGVEDEETF